ncbi:MAG TPA: hypothetical protein VHZ78_08855 [Rhizomicrobium sp.]|jgi:hypothetical protein|nr:hypothetical protein [Rhizomicrobium sp.]
MSFDPNWVIAFAAVAQTCATGAAIRFTVSVARDQARQALDLKDVDRAREGAARDARANIAAFRLIPVVEEILRGLDHLAGISTNSTQLYQLRSSLARAGVPAKETWLPALSIKVGWSDNLYEDFDALPPTLARRAVLLLYKVEQFNRSYVAEATSSADDLQRLTAWIRTRHDEIRAELNIVRVALNAFAPAPPPACL